jgi:hypothetical protein
MYDEASRTPIWNSTAYQITNLILMNEDGKRIVPDATATASLRQLPACVFLRFDLTIDPTAVYGECLEARFALKSGVAIIREAILGSKLFIGGYIFVSSPH